MCDTCVDMSLVLRISLDSTWRDTLIIRGYLVGLGFSPAASQEFITGPGRIAYKLKDLIQMTSSESE